VSDIFTTDAEARAWLKAQEMGDEGKTRGHE
jgi:hypothetical protein